MKFIKILLGFLLCLFGKEGISQQHLTKTWSVSTGITFNTKGVNTIVHYHLNSFDELRLNFYRIRHPYFVPTTENELPLKTTSLNLEFSKGYKFRRIKNATTYFGMGFFWGKEKVEEDLLPINNIFGVSSFHESEYAPLNWLALFARIKMLIPLGLVRSKSFRLTIGSRFYF